MQPSRGAQITLIVAVGALFFIASFALGQGPGHERSGVIILALACVAVLGLIGFIARKAQRAAQVETARIEKEPTTPAPARGSKLRTIAFLAALALIELTQLKALPYWARAAAVVIAIGLFIWAIVSSRRARRG